MQDVSKKLRVLSATQVKQSAGGVAIKAGVRAGLMIASPISTGLNAGVFDSALIPSLDTGIKDAAKM